MPDILQDLVKSNNQNDLVPASKYCISARFLDREHRRTITFCHKKSKLSSQRTHGTEINNCVQMTHHLWQSSMDATLASNMHRTAAVTLLRKCAPTVTSAVVLG